MSPPAAPRLTNLEGRRALVFRDGEGELLNNVDLSAVLNPLRVPRFHLHQQADGRVVVRVAPMEMAAEVSAALTALFGPGIAIDVLELPPEETDGPVARYTSDLPFSIP